MARSIALFLAALALAVPATAADDVTMRLGGKVTISEPVEGSLNAAGGKIAVDAAVAGDAQLAGGKVTVRAPIQGDVSAAGGKVTLDSAIGGNASVAAGTLVLGPNANIVGKLTFHGTDLRRDSAAVVGELEHKPGNVRHSYVIDDDSVELHAISWAWTAGLLVLAALIAAALPGPTRRMTNELRERPFLTTLVGLVALATIPVAAVLLMVTIIGIPLGLLAIAGYAALLLVGYVWLAVVVGGLLLDRVKPETAAATAWRAGAAALAMLALALLAKVPFIGGLVALTALVVGVGMIVAVIARRTPEAAPVAAV